MMRKGKVGEGRERKMIMKMTQDEVVVVTERARNGCS